MAQNLTDSILFQFLSRNSVRWDHFGRRGHVVELPVSIPQSEFCPLGPEFGRYGTGTLMIVSIPQSEFCPLGLEYVIPKEDDRRKFQFLSRNSVRWDAER